jgi:hypothetical protein
MNSQVLPESRPPWFFALQVVQEDCGRVWSEQDAVKAKTETDEQERIEG